MTEDLLSRIKEALEGVTPGPWWVPGDWIATEADIRGDVVCERPSRSIPHSYDRWHGNAAYIALLSPENVRALIGEVERLTDERDEAIRDRNAHAEHVRRVAAEASDGFVALEEMDRCWEAYGTPNNRAHLSLSEQITATHTEMCDLDCRATNAEREVERLQTEVLNAAFSDRLDMEAGGSPLTWKEVAQAAEREVERLWEALEKGAEWFEEYADHHQAKGALDKASRNLERANYLRRARQSLQGTGE
jgi:hypothetical protein